MANVTIVGSNFNVLSGTIADNGTLTHEIDLGEYTLTGLIQSTAGWVAGTLSFQVSAQSDANGGTFIDLLDTDGTTYEISAPTGRFAIRSDSVVQALAGYRYVKIKSSVSQTGGPIQFYLPVKA